MLIDSLKKYINTSKKCRQVWLCLCLAVLIIGIAGGINSGNKNARIEKVKAAQTELKEKHRTANENKEQPEPLRQNKDIPGIVLLNVGEKSNTDIKGKDIHNILVVVFNENNRKSAINLVAVQKETCVGYSSKKNIEALKETFDKDDPQKFYDAIEKVIDYKVGSYIVYNNDTIKGIMDLLYIVYINVEKADWLGVDDIPRINEEQKKLTSEYLGVKSKDITRYGWQALDSLQAVAYSNTYYEIWNCIHSDWRQMYLFTQLINGIKGSNYSELEQIRKILLSGDNKIEEKELILAGAAIKNCNNINLSRWSSCEKQIEYRGKKYVLPWNSSKILEYIHKTKGHERTYKRSDAAKNMQKN